MRDPLNLQIFEKAKQYVESRLESELSPNLLYHGIGHTRDEVVPAVSKLADMEGVHNESLYLLLTAAWFHDIGFIRQATNHELISVQIAKDVLPSYGYSQKQVEIISKAILATALPQSPANLLEQLLVDADLDILGRENFMERNNDLRQELASLGKEYTDEQWYSGQLKFMEGHKYFTTSARSLSDSQKLLNIAELKNIMKELAARD